MTNNIIQFYMFANYLSVRELSTFDARTFMYVSVFS